MLSQLAGNLKLRQGHSRETLAPEHWLERLWLERLWLERLWLWILWLERLLLERLRLGAKGWRLMAGC